MSNLYSVVAVFRVEDEPRQVGRQVKAAEIQHQVPEDDGVLAEEFVGVDHLVGRCREANVRMLVHGIKYVYASVCVNYLISLILQ